MEFKEIYKRDIERNKIALGSRKGSILTVDFNESSSIIITGETGSGKSVMVNQILLQLIKNYTTDELRFIIIDTSGVELNLYDNNDRTILSAFNDLDKSQKVLFRVLEEIERRKDILREYSVLSINEYNEKFNKNIPNLAVVIDDNQSLLNRDDISSMIKTILDKLQIRLNIIFILATNNVYNELFDNFKSKPNNIFISFDLADKNNAETIGMPFSNDLLTGKFLVNVYGNYEEYNNFEFDDNLIKEIID